VLLERAEPLALLEGALARAREGRGHTVLIGGEAGIGKTSLLEHFVAERAGGARVLWGACEALATPRPLGPLADIAESLKGPLLDALRSLRAPHELFQVFLGALREHDRPSLVVIEDAHWLDDASADFLRFVARRIARYPALVAVTCREEEVSPRHPIMRAVADVPADHLTRLALQRLSPEGVEALARRHGRSIPNLHALSEGNPFLVTELVRNDERASSATLRGTVLARLAQLDAEARSVAELVSVMPDRMERQLLDRVLPMTDDALQACTERGLLVVDREHVRFRHELSRRVVEESLGVARRRELNARVLALLADEPLDATTLARLVHHADAAQDGASVLRHAPTAATAAAKRGAHRQAAAFLRTALSYGERLPSRERAALLDRLAQEAFACDSNEEALDANERAFVLWRGNGDTLAQGRNRRTRFEFGEHANYGDRTAFASELELAVKLLEPHGPSTDLAMAYVDWSFRLSMHGRHEDAQSFHDKALAMAESLGDPYALAHVLLLGERRCHSFVGTPSLQRTERALELALRSGDEALAALAWALYATFARSGGNLRALERALEGGLRFVEARDLDGQRMVLRSQAAWGALLRGDWDAVPEIAAEVPSRPQVPGLAYYFARSSVALARARRGEAGALAQIEEAVEAVRARLDSPASRINWSSTLAEVHWLAGGRDAALESARQAFEGAREMAATAARFGVTPIWGHGVRVNGWWLWREAALEIPTNMGGPMGLQLNGDWRSAARIWSESGMPYHRAMSLMDGDEPARREAFAILEKLGATATIERCREMLAVRGVRGIPRGPRATTRANPMGLTGREVEILCLLEQGLANAQISRRLHRSEKTVGHHVSAILAKLGAATRQEAAHIARSKGFLDR
jgi:DNA-binding CsgD family transcriptional regulator/tetratricopeptide (TPR) repeat protein